MKKTFLFVILVVLSLFPLTQRALAQGSPYDFIGFGTPVQSGDPIIEALGGTGVALGESRTINNINPADWIWMNRARFNISLRYDYNNFQLGTDRGAEHNIGFNGLTFGAPFWSEYSATVAIGYVPLTNASGEIDQTGSGDSAKYQSKGGTNMLFLGVGAEPWKGLALGARFDLVTGDIRHQDIISFSDMESQSGEFERDYFFYGIRPTFGLELIGDSLTDVLSGWTIGASYSLGTNLTSTRETIVTPANSTLDTTLDDGGKGYYPSSLTVGIAYKFSHRYRGEVDYAEQNFSTAYVFSPNSISGDPTLRNSMRASIGIERLANVAGEFGTSFGLDRWALRLGFYFSQLPLNPAGSGGINELGLSAGVGIPVSYESLLNFSLIGGQRLPVTSGGAPKETFIRLGASISLSERWFVPTRR